MKNTPIPGKPGNLTRFGQFTFPIRYGNKKMHLTIQKVQVLSLNGHLIQLHSWLEVSFIFMGIRYKMLECYIETWFCLLPSLFSFTSNAVLHSLCPHGSVDMGHGGMSSTPHPSVILFGGLYETHCCTVQFHLACVHHRSQDIDKRGGKEEWQVLCLRSPVTGNLRTQNYSCVP